MSDTTTEVSTVLVEPPKKLLPTGLELVKFQNGALEITTVQDLAATCELMVKSGYFTEGDARVTVSQAVVKTMFGLKMGLDPLESINDLYMFKGQCSAFARLHARKIKEHQNYNYRVLESSPESVTVAFFDDKAMTVSSGPDITFTMEQAKEAGWTDKKFSAWSVDPEGMLFNKCITRAYRKYYPDLYRVAVITREEVEEIETAEAKRSRRKSGVEIKSPAEILAERDEQPAEQSEEPTDVVATPAQETREEQDKILDEVFQKEEPESPKQDAGVATEETNTTGSTPDLTSSTVLQDAGATTDPKQSAALEIAASSTKDIAPAAAAPATTVQTSGESIDMSPPPNDDSPKIQKKDVIALVKFAKTCGYSATGLAEHLGTAYGLDQKTWSDELTVVQSAAAQQWLEANRK